MEEHLFFIAEYYLKLKKLPAKLRFFTAKDGSKLLSIKKYYVLAAAIGSYAAIFYSSHYNYNLSIISVVLNILLFTLVSVIIAVVCVLAINIKTKREEILQGLLFLLFIYYMRVPVTENMQILYIDLLGHHPSSNIMLIFSLVLGTAFFGLGWLLSGDTYKVVAVIAMMSLLPLANIGKGIYLMASERMAQDVVEAGLGDRDIIFHRKPNVYFLLFDSYTNTEGLQAMGLSHSSTIIDYLSKNQFVAYPSFYTNMQLTRYAMSSYFVMDVKFKQKNIYNIFYTTKQEIISGKNMAFNIFKKNGYKNKIIMVDGAGFRLNEYMRGQFCFADHCLAHKNNNIFLTHLQLIDRILFNRAMLRSTTRYINEHDHTMSILRREIGSEEKQFVYAHFIIPNHAEYSRVDRKGTCDEKVEIQKYGDRLVHANHLITKAVDMIRQSDPGALIVIASDHGPTIFNRCAANSPLLTWEEVVERQSVFLAVRWGNDYDGRYDHDIKTSANLFRYIFSYLAGHEKLLQDKPDDDAFYLYKGEIIKSIDNGVILPPPADELSEMRK